MIDERDGPRWLRPLSIVLALVAIGALATACGPRHVSQGKMDLKLGVIVPETGTTAFLGTPQRNAVLLAAERWRAPLAQKGISLTPVFADSQGSPQTAVSAYSKLKLSPGMAAVLVATTGPARAVRPLAERDNVLLLATVADPSITAGSRYLVRPYYSYRDEGTVMADEARRLGAHMVGVLYSTDASSAYQAEQVLLPALKRKGIAFSAQNYKPGSRDFRSQLTALKGASPDLLIFNSISDKDVLALVAGLREQGLFRSGRVIGGLTAFSAYELGGGRYLAGVRILGPAFALGAPGNAGEYGAFVREMRSRFPQDPPAYWAAYAYDGYAMIAQALMKSGSADVRRIMSAIAPGSYKGLAGEYAISPDGDAKTPIAYCEVGADGKTRPLGVFR